MTEIQDLRQGPAAAGPGNGGAGNGVRKSAAALMAFAAATLAAVSPLHLTGVIGGTSGPYDPRAAGIAEAVIGAVLVAALIAAWRMPGQARPLAVAAVGFAIFGFLVGLSITARGGDAVDIAYHSAILPVLIVTFILLLRPGSRETPAPR